MSSVDENVHNFQLGCRIFAHEYNSESSQNSTQGKRGVNYSHYLPKQNWRLKDELCDCIEMYYVTA